MKLLLSFLFLGLQLACFSQEICDNGIDDDLDGLIDLQDTTDCFCQLSTPDSSIAALIPNPSFEQRSCCPSASSQMNCVDNWIQATGATADYFNSCGLLAVGTFPAPPLPLPNGNGNGYVGFFDNFGTLNLPYKEYIGTCLTDTTEMGITYQVDYFISNSLGNLTTEIAIYGTTDCANLPFGSPANTASSYCPTTVAPLDWTLLDIDTVTCSSSSWVSGSLSFTSNQNYEAIIIGGSCRNNPNSNYYFLDNITIKQTSLFDPQVSIKDSGHYCQKDLILKAEYDSIPNTFQWYRDSIAIIGATNSFYSVPNGQPGNYQLIVTYDSTCLLTEVYEVDTTLIEFELDSSGTCLSGLQTGEIVVSNVSSGVSPFRFQLNTQPFNIDTVFQNLQAGLYTITVEDSNGCQGIKTISVDRFPSPSANFISDSVCVGFETSFTDLSTISSGIITNWSWSIPGNPAISNPTYTFPNSGNFTINLVVTSNLGCQDDTTISVVVNPKPTAYFTYTPQELTNSSSEVCFINQSTGANSYFWNFDFSGLQGTSVLENPCTIAFPSNKQTYEIVLFARSLFGCFDSTTTTISILDDISFYIPNSFSPNGDDLNEELKIITSGINKFELQIFNRWGELIFETKDGSENWDGRYKGNLVSNGAYVYRVTLKAKNGLVKEISGHINVVK